MFTISQSCQVVLMSALKAMPRIQQSQLSFSGSITSYWANCEWCCVKFKQNYHNGDFWPWNTIWDWISSTILNCVSVITSNLCLVPSWSIAMGFEVDIILNGPDVEISSGFLKKIKQTNEKLYCQISGFSKTFCLWTFQKKALNGCKFIFVNSYIGTLSWQRN